MYDRIETIGKSVIQHGKQNDRVYLMKLAASDFPGIIPQLEEMAVKEGYGKIFAKLPGWTQKEMILRRYKIEASVPFFYNAEESAVFFAGFIDPARETMEKKTREAITGIIEKAGSLFLKKRKLPLQVLVAFIFWTKPMIPPCPICTEVYLLPIRFRCLSRSTLENPWTLTRCISGFLTASVWRRRQARIWTCRTGMPR